MVLTTEQLTALGAEIVAGYVNYKGTTIEGNWTSNGFDPAEGTLLFAIDEAAVKTAMKANKAAAA
jgi:hypothetical protein